MKLKHALILSICLMGTIYASPERLLNQEEVDADIEQFETDVAIVALDRQTPLSTAVGNLTGVVKSNVGKITAAAEKVKKFTMGQAAVVAALLKQAKQSSEAIEEWVVVE